MRRESTDRLACQLMLVFIQLISTWIVVNHMTGAHVATLNWIHSATASASGLWPVWDLLALMFLNPATSNSATAKCQQTHHSATELINTYSNGPQSTTEVSGAWQELVHSFWRLDIGSSPSTSDSICTIACCVSCFYLNNNLFFPVVH